MYNENTLGCESVAMQLTAKGDSQTRTVGDNIDLRIAHHTNEITRLTKIKEQLSNGASLLDVNISDLRDAMSY